MSTENRRKLEGVIKSRRCHGKHLSFATLSCGEDGKDAVKVMFCRKEFDDDTHFPTKLSAMPYGASVRLEVVDTGKESLLVRSWDIVGEHPREQALQLAQEATGGVSCSKYLEARSNVFLSLHGDRMKELAANGNSRKRQKQDSTLSTNTNDDTVHGNAQTRNLRAKIFAEWLIKNLPLLPVDRKSDGNSEMASPPTILDVAGGKGHLSVELAKFGAVCTVIDPLIRSKRNLKRLEKSRRNTPQSEIPTFVAARFEKDKVTDTLVAENYSCLIGFHPDEVTEDIVDMALRHGKLFAVVPCCVFPSFFPMRKLDSGKMVNSYDEFLDYLLQKDPRLRRASLPFEGKNQVIYLPFVERKDR